LTNVQLPPDPKDWLDGATEHSGSWWADWAAWNAGKSGPKVPARQPGEGKLAPIEDAPGAYARVRAL
jgi:polyhydroxyalkanoate synthase